MKTAGDRNGFKAFVKVPLGAHVSKPKRVMPF